MTLYDLKPRFQGLLRPLVAALAGAGVTANQVTVVAAVGSLLLGLSLAMAPTRLVFLVVPAWLFARMALNAVDGMLAREHGQASPLGACLNEIGDVFSDAAIYLPFALVPGIGAGWVVVVVVLSGLTELAGVLGTTIGASRRYDGPAGKSDRAFLFGLLGLLVGLGVELPQWAGWVMPALAALLAVTVGRRVRSAVAEVRGAPSGTMTYGVPPGGE